MRTFDYYAVTHEAGAYCIDCRPVNEAHPIFADSEWDYYPTCDVCGEVHKYVTLTDEGVMFENRELREELMEFLLWADGRGLVVTEDEDDIISAYIRES